MIGLMQGGDVSASTIDPNCAIRWASFSRIEFELSTTTSMSSRGSRHRPSEQDCVAEQLFPHAPQFCRSDDSSTHTPAHRVSAWLAHWTSSPLSEPTVCAHPTT